MSAAPRRNRTVLIRRMRGAVYRRAEGVMGERLEAGDVNWADVGAAVDVARDEFETLIRALGPLAALTDQDMGEGWVLR